MEKFEYPLTPEQIYFYERQKEFPDSTMFNNYPILMKLKDWVDLQKLSECIIKTIQAHPAFSTVIEERNGVLIQKYVPDLIRNIKIEKISEAEFQTVKEDFVQPLYMNETMLRIRLFETEKAKYFFYDVHQIICDGYAKNLWAFDMDKVYAGEELKPDGWFSYLEERENEKFLPHYEESRLYYENLYGNTEWSRYPKTDFSGENKNKQGILLRDTDILEGDLEILKNYYLTYNEFFSIISLLSTAMFNNSENVISTWTYKGRWEKSHRNIVGAMIMDMPLALNLKDMTVKQVFRSIREQVKGSLLHRDYPYTSLDKNILKDDILCVIDQGKTYDIVNNPKLVNVFEKILKLNSGNRGIGGSDGGSDNVIDVDFSINQGHVQIVFDYAAHKYKSETIKKFSDTLIECANKLLILMKENKCGSGALF